MIEKIKFGTRKKFISVLFIAISISAENAVKFAYSPFSLAQIEKTNTFS